jgi:hypothetical protein
VARQSRIIFHDQGCRSAFFVRLGRGHVGAAGTGELLCPSWLANVDTKTWVTKINVCTVPGRGSARSSTTSASCSTTSGAPARNFVRTGVPVPLAMRLPGIAHSMFRLRDRKPRAQAEALAKTQLYLAASPERKVIPMKQAMVAKAQHANEN